MTTTVPALRFDPGAHLYYLDEEHSESVTQVLHGLGIINSDHYPETARIRGVRTHTATVLFEAPGRGRTFNWESLRPIEEAIGEAIAPRVRGWEAFLNRTGWKSRIIERPNYHPIYRYCGTQDRIGRFPGDAAETVLDIKTGGPEPWWKWQTGGYEEMERAHDGQRRHRLCVELRADGRYKMHRHEGAEDAAEFIDMLATYRAGRRLGYFQEIPIPENAL